MIKEGMEPVDAARRGSDADDGKFAGVPGTRPTSE
jgi:hypothetical protein